MNFDARLEGSGLEDNISRRKTTLEGNSEVTGAEFKMPNDSGEDEDGFKVPDDSGEDEDGFKVPNDSGEDKDGFKVPDDSGEDEDDFELPDDSGEADDDFEPPDDFGETDSGQDDKKDSDVDVDSPVESDGAEQEKDEPEQKMEPPVKISFKCPEGYDEGEFNRQIKNQEKGLNDMTLGQFLENRKKYQENKEKNEDGCGRDKKEGDPAQKRAREEAKADKVKEYREQGMSRREAEAKAEEWVRSQNALHNPDQVAGGDPKKVDGVGDSRVNKSIGGQWKSRADSLEQQIRDYIEKNGIPAEDLGKIKMNVQLDVA